MSTTLLPDRPQWLAARPSFIGSSDGPPILGVGFADEDISTVWVSKVYPGTHEREDNDALLCGRELQPGITNIARIKTGYDIRPANEFEIFRHDEYPWLGCTPDSFIDGDARGLGICEIKNVDIHNLGDWKQNEPPLRVAVQLMHQLLAVGATWGIAFGLCGGNTPKWFELERHTRLIDGMVPALRDFWRLVETRTPPPINGSAGSARVLKAIYPEDDGGTVDMPPQAQAWFDDLSAIKAAEKVLKARRKSIENGIEAAIGNATYGELPDARKFSWKKQTTDYPPKEAYSVSFRVLRQHEPKRRALEEVSLSKRFARATAALSAIGATMLDESESGSRYFETAGGLKIRVADHEPNEKTAGWMDRREVASVRVDDPNWKQQLEAITGAISFEE